MGLQAILFDFDGTLADTLPLIFRCFREILSDETGRCPTDQDIVAMFGPTEEGMLRRALPESQYAGAVEKLYTLYDTWHPEYVSANVEIEQLLIALKQAAYPLAIVTGKGRRTAEISLRHLGWAKYFDVIVTGDDVQRPKPHPEGLQRALRTLNVPASNALYAGDSEADVAAGRAAGLVTVAVTWLGHPQTVTFSNQPDYLLDDVRNFSDVLNGMRVAP